MLKKIIFVRGTILYGVTTAKDTSYLLGETSISRRVVQIANLKYESLPSFSSIKQ